MWCAPRFGTGLCFVRYTERLAEAGIEPSVGSRGDSYDNVLAETINGLYKTQQVKGIAIEQMIEGLICPSRNRAQTAGVRPVGRVGTQMTGSPQTSMRIKAERVTPGNSRLGAP